jgi:hypothetical protein
MGAKIYIKVWISPKKTSLFSKIEQEGADKRSYVNLSPLKFMHHL